MIEDSKGDKRFKQMLATGNEENFKWAYQIAYDRAFGKAVQQMDINDISEQRLTREDLESAIGDLKALTDRIRGNKEK